jgi:hypothetical protein
MEGDEVVCAWVRRGAVERAADWRASAPSMPPPLCDTLVLMCHRAWGREAPTQSLDLDTPLGPAGLLGLAGRWVGQLKLGRPCRISLKNHRP